MRILITGGSGFIGQALCRQLIHDQHFIIVLTRNSKQAQQRLGQSVRVIHQLTAIDDHDAIDAVINLAGEPIADRRWSHSQKKRLIDSRIHTTQALLELFSRLYTQPKVFISASAIGYYGPHGDNDTALTESSPPIAGFTHELCQQWEAAALKTPAGIRTCITRLAVVLGPNGGMLKKLLPLFRFGLGGRLGSGKQYMSWVHIDDVIAAFLYLLHDEQAHGVFNISSPNAVPNQVFTQILGHTLKRPTYLVQPAWLIRRLFGEMGDVLLLQGQNVLPEKLSEQGFIFAFPTLAKALADIVQRS